MARGPESTFTETLRESRTYELFSRLERVSEQSDRRRISGIIVETNLPLCDALARRYARRGAEHDDLVQVARVGLVLAVERFRPDEGNSFVAFAVPTIVGELRRYFRDHCWAVRPSRTIQELRPMVESARADLLQSLRREPREDEVAEHLGTDPDQVRACVTSATNFRPVSLDAPVGDGSIARLGDVIASSTDLTGLDEQIDLRRAIGRLSLREQRALALRYGEDLTQAEIGERLGVSQMQVSRILRTALDRLRVMLDGDVNRAA